MNVNDGISCSVGETNHILPQIGTEAFSKVYFNEVFDFSLFVKVCFHEKP